MAGVGKLGEKSEKHEHEHPVKIVPNSFEIKRIGDFLKNAKQLIERLDIHDNLHAKMNGFEKTKNAKHIDDMIGYLLRKKHQLANYEERHARGEWIASTRVEMLFGRTGTPGSKAAGDGTTLRFRNDANITA